MTRSRIVICALAPLVGCTVYEPVPLEPEQEWHRMEALRLENLTRAAAESSVAENPLPPFDYSNGLSAEEAAGLAVVLNPDLRAFRLQRGIAEAQLTAAGILPNPEISTKWLVPTNASVWKTEVDAAIDLTQLLLRRGLEKDRARIHIEEVRWEIAEKEWRLASEVRLAFVELLSADDALAIVESQRKVRDRILAGARQRQNAGASAPLDTLLAETDLADVERQALRLAGERKRALQTLNRAIGLPPNHATRIEESTPALTYAPVKMTRQEAALDLWKRRPDLLAAEQAYVGAEKELEIACRKQVPSFKVGPSYERDGGENLFGLNAALALPLFDRNQGGIASKLAEREERRRHYEAVLASARAELEAAWTDLDALDAELRYYFDRVAPGLDRILQVTDRALQAGDVSLYELLGVQRRVLESRSEVQKTLRDFHKAQVNVLRAAGPALSPPPPTEAGSSHDAAARDTPEETPSPGSGGHAPPDGPIASRSVAPPWSRARSSAEHGWHR